MTYLHNSFLVFFSTENLATFFSHLGSQRWQHKLRYKEQNWMEKRVKEHGEMTVESFDCGFVKFCRKSRSLCSKTSWKWQRQICQGVALTIYTHFPHTEATKRLHLFRQNNSGKSFPTQLFLENPKNWEIAALYMVLMDDIISSLGSNSTTEQVFFVET